MSTRIHQEVTFRAPVESVYNALTSSDQFAAVTSAAAEVSIEEGGIFSCFDGQITGRHVELKPNERIVQAWRVETWEPGVWSLVRFELQADGDGTTLTFDQTGYPEEAHEHLDSGWHKMYWEPLRKSLERKTCQ